MASAFLPGRSESRPWAWSRALRRSSERCRETAKGSRKASRRGNRPRSRPGATSASRRSSSSRTRKRCSIAPPPFGRRCRPRGLYAYGLRLVSKTIQPNYSRPFRPPFVLFLRGVLTKVRVGDEEGAAVHLHDLDDHPPLGTLPQPLDDFCFRNHLTLAFAHCREPPPLPWLGCSTCRSVPA